MRDATKPKRRCFQFGLKSLFALVAAFCIGFAWLGWRLHEKRVERAAAAEFLTFDAGARVTYNWKNLGHPPGPPWLRAVFGDDFFCSVSSVTLRGENTTDQALAPLSRLPGLLHLSLEYTSVTDAGLSHLAPLDHLRFLGIGAAPNITDEGLRHLRGLKHLESLNLAGTKVTNAGVAELKLALPDCSITLR